jgi:hypothetical protein
MFCVALCFLDEFRNALQLPVRNGANVKRKPGQICLAKS